MEYALALGLLGLIVIAGIGKLETSSTSELSNRAKSAGNPDGFVPVAPSYGPVTTPPSVVTTMTTLAPLPTTIVPPTVVTNPPTVAPTSISPQTTVPATTVPPTTLAPGTGPGIHVESMNAIATKTGKVWSASVVIEILDNNGDPIQNVTVAGSWSAGNNSTTTCETDLLGRCSMTQWNMEARSTRAGHVPETTLTITNLIAPANQYQPSKNVLNTLTISKP